MSKETELFELLEPLVTREGYECKDVTFQKNGKTWVLTVFIDKPEGISLEDCEYISRILSPYLDEVDPIEPSYLLEVSSPGIDRPLKTDEDLKENINNIVDIKLFKKQNGKKNYQGQLLSFDKDKITIQEDKNTLEFNRSEISKIAPAILFN